MKPKPQLYSTVQSFTSPCYLPFDMKKLLWTILLAGIWFSTSAKIKIDLSTNDFPAAHPVELAYFISVLESLIKGPNQMNDSTRVLVDKMGMVSVIKPPVNNGVMSTDTILKVINDTTCVEVLLEQKTTTGWNVVMGAWRGDGSKESILLKGDGKQSIDMLDIIMLPSREKKQVISPEVLLMHELFEAYIGRNACLDYASAHVAAEIMEVMVINEDNPGGDYYRLNTVDRGPCKVLRWEEDISRDTIELKIIFNEFRTIIDTKVNILKGNPQRSLSSTSNKSIFGTQLLTNGCGPQQLCIIEDLEMSALSYTPVANTNAWMSSYLAAGGEGQYFVGDIASSQIHLIFEDGSIVITYGHPDLDLPSGIVFDNQRQWLFVADASRESVFVFEYNGTFVKEIVHHDISIPTELVLDNEGHLIISNHGLDNILVIDVEEDTVVSKIQDPNLSSPAGMAYDGIEDVLYVVDNTNERIIRFNYGTATYLDTLALDTHIIITLGHRFGKGRNISPGSNRSWSG